MKRIISVLLLVCLMAAMLTVPAFAEEYYAPTQADFENVLSMAADGDLVRLAQGEYKLPSEFSGKALTIQGAGSDKTMVKLPADFAGGISFVDAATDNPGGAALPPSSGGAAPKLLAPKSGSVPTASVNGVDYPTIQAAVDAAGNDDTVYITSSGTMDISAGVTNSDGYYTLVNVAGKSITIDLNGCSISADAKNLPAGVKSGLLLGVISADVGANLILMDSSGSGSVSVNANGSDVYALINNYEGTMEIKSGNYSADGLGNGRGMIFDGGHSRTTVTGGNFTLANLGSATNGSPWIFNASGQNTAHVNVFGGTFNDDVFHQYYPFEVNDDAIEYALRNNGNGTWTVVPSVCWVNEKHKSGKWYTNEVGFASLEDAIAAADDNVANKGSENSEERVITLINDVTLNSSVTSPYRLAVDGDVLVDLNGNDLTALIDTANGKLTVVGDGKISSAEGNIFAAQPTKAQLAVAGGTWYGFNPTKYLVSGATATEIADNVWKVNAPAVVPGPSAKPGAANPYSVPATGDNSNVPLWALLFVLFAAVAVVTGRKRKA